MSGRQLKRIDEADEYSIKYNGPYPLHAAADVGDTEAVELLAKRKHVNSYNEIGQMPLHIATRKGHLETVKKLLLDLDADVNAPERFSGKTALHLAALEGHVHIVEVLLKHGAVVYDQDRNGTYPVHLAAKGGYCHVVKLLVAAGALVTGIDKNNEQPLHYAAEADKADCVEVLNGFGGNLDAANKDGETPLHIAAVFGSTNAIRKLYKLGANLEATDQCGDTPLHHAARTQKLESIEVLAEVGADLYARNDDKECPIHLAVRLGRWKSVRHLLTAGVEIDTPYKISTREELLCPGLNPGTIKTSKVKKRGLQAIHIAAQHGGCDVIRVLKIEHVDLNSKDKDKFCAIHHAVICEQAEVIRVLKELGADINAPGKKGNTAIHLAAKQKKTKFVQLLGSLGANCMQENELFLFPLYYAVVNGDIETVKCLQRYGADLNTLNTEGEGLVHIMVEQESFEGLKTMKEVNADFGLLDKNGKTCIRIALEEDQTQVLKHLKDIGVDLNLRDKWGLSALHMAVLEGKGDVVDMLNNIGVDINCQSKNFSRDEDMPQLCKYRWPPTDIDRQDYWKIKVGMTPLHVAFCNDQVDILYHLVTCGADINIGNDIGETVFHFAVLFNLVDWLQQLLPLGADRNCKDKYGRTPLHYAAHTGSLECLRVLLKFGAVITETDNEGRQPLHYAAESGHFLLLPEFTGHSRSIDINCTDTDGCTPLHFACSNGHVDTIVELIYLNANVEAQDCDGNTVVHLAAMNGQSDVLVQLASLGCNMDVKNKALQTPFHLAGEKCQGEVMEYLLMCGCNPNIRDKNGNLASTFRLASERKRAVTKRIKQYNEDNASRHTAGEISYDCRMLFVGKPIELPRLGITVTLESSVEVRPIVFIHRTPADNAHQEIALKGFEEILSDGYELRVLCLETECTLVIEIPLDGYTGKFETFLKTADGDEIPEYTTSEKNGVPTFVGRIPVDRGTIKKFAVISRPRIYSHSIGAEGGTVISEIDRNIRLELPAGSYENQTTLKMQVLETRDMERKVDQIFAGDVVHITGDFQPMVKIKIQIPLHDTPDDIDDIVVFVVNSEDELEDEHRWWMLECPIKQQNDCITFWVKGLGIFVPVNIPSHSHLGMDAAKKVAREHIKKSLHRETSALFFYAICPKKDTYLAIFECTTPGRFQRRREFWENEGFFFHAEVKHSGHYAARPNQTFFFDITGNMQYVGNNSRRLKLTFNPRSYKFQSFYLERVDKNKPQIGELEVFTNLVENDAKTGTKDILITKIPIEIPEKKTCVIS